MTSPIHPSEEHGQENKYSKDQSYFQGHVISVRLDEVSSKDKSLEKSFLSHLSQHFSSQEKPMFSEHSRQAQYLLNDVLTAGRTIGTLFKNSGKNIQNLLGLAGVYLIGTGATSVSEGVKAKNSAIRALDLEEEKKAQLAIEIGVAETSMGTAAVTSRSLNLTSSLEGVNSGVSATSSLGQATFSFGMLGGIFSAAWYGLISFSAWASLKEVWKIEEGLKNPENALDFLKGEVNFGVDKTLDVLKTTYQKQLKNSITTPSFKDWCKEILKKEAIDLTKDFLKTINPNESQAYDFEKMASNMLETKWALKSVVPNEEISDLKDLDLSPVELLGFESLHRNRLKMVKTVLSRSMGNEALEKVLKLAKEEVVSEPDKKELLESVNKGLVKTKTENTVVLVFVAFGVAVLAAGMVAACIACPPLGLIVACAVFTIFVTLLMSYVDIKNLINTWNKPIGKLEDLANTTKLLMGIGCIAGICILSGATLGTLPVVFSLIIVSSVVATSLFRYIHAMKKKREEKEMSGSMNSLIEKLESFRTSNSLTDRQKEDKIKTEEKIKKIIYNKFLRTHPSILKKISEEQNGWEERILQPISSYEIETLKSDIKKWKDAEDSIIQELKEAFDTLEGVPESRSDWIFAFKQAFIGVPHLERIFPQEKGAS